jgi:hypothetical protein
LELSHTAPFVGGGKRGFGPASTPAG